MSAQVGSGNLIERLKKIASSPAMPNFNPYTKALDEIEDEENPNKRIGSGMLLDVDGLRRFRKRVKSHSVADFLILFRSAEFDLGGFLLPWGMVICSVGFLLALGLVRMMERLHWTRAVWHLPLFFLSLAVLAGCVVGLLFAP